MAPCSKRYPGGVRRVIVLALALLNCGKVVDEPPRDAAPDARDGGGDADSGAPPEVWCATQWPQAAETNAGEPTELLFVRVRVEGVTPTSGGDPSLAVELGYGPRDQPISGPGWRWVAAEHNGLCDGCPADQDEYMGAVTPEAPGELLWGARVLDEGGGVVHCDRADEGRRGSDDGWSAEDAPALTVREAPRLRVVTLNLRCLADDWDRRRPLVIDGLAAIDPDLMGFQEVCAEPSSGRDNLGELLAGLAERTGRTYVVHRAVTHFSFDRYDEGLALVSAHGLIRQQEEDLPAGIFPRKVLLARSDTPIGPIALATTHLDHRSSEARAEQAGVLARWLAAATEADEPVVLTGDFNEEPDGGEVHATLSGSGLTDLWALLRPGEPGLTFPASGPEIRIDAVWLRAGAAGPEAVSIERFLDRAEGGVTGSDHLGLNAELRRGASD